MNYRTKQEKFWSGEFGTEYTSRNNGKDLIISNLALFSKILNAAPNIKSIVELGCNRGMNLQVLKKIKDFELSGYEINQFAADEAKKLNIADIIVNSILDIKTDKKYDLVFTKGVLIHIDPKDLEQVYEKIYNISNSYILVCEYYSRSPEPLRYRGHEGVLFKSDFAGQLIDKFNLRLIDYGFVYHRDNYFPQDDLTWFLLQK
jgi:pseudaminic acid biosynthesis-associated methylase